MKKLLFAIFLVLNVNGYQSVESSFTDPLDRQTYKTVKIGDQIWLAENLNYDAGEGCWFNNHDSSMGKRYGRPYDWTAAKRAVPSGWHLPDKDEYDELINHLGGPTQAYKSLIEGGDSIFNILNIRLKKTVRILHR